MASPECLVVGDQAGGGGADINAEIDRQTAMRELLKESPAIKSSITEEADDMQATVTGSDGGSGARRPNPGQLALRRLREAAGLTQNVMATRLGLKLPTYQSYEYGRTKKVPKRVLDAARNLVVDPEYSYVIAMYGSRKMADIANEWARRMGLKQNSPVELAKALGINKSSTSRWLRSSANVVLSPEDLIMYERRVAKEEAYYQSVLKRHGNLHA